MRIWIIHQNAYAPSHSASSRHFELSRQLVQKGHDVLIVASSFYHKGREETRLHPGEWWRKETIDGVRYLWLWTPAYNGNGLARLWNMLIYTILVLRSKGLRDEPPPDVVIGSSPHLFSPWAAMRLASRLAKPFVLEIRDIWPAVLVEMGGVAPWHPLVQLLRWLEKTYYRRAEKVISILPMADRHIEESIGRSDHVVWIPNGSPLDPIDPLPQRERPLTFMYAGAHSLYSGLDVVLDAAKMLTDEGWSDRVRIRLVGDGPEKERLIADAQRLGLSIVSFEPPVPKSHVFELLSQADAFLMVYKDAPLMQYGLCPNKLYDYMGAARPVVFGLATPNDPVRESGAGLSVAPQNAAALAEGIKQIVETPWPERLEMGRRGRAYVQQYHNFATLGEKLDRVLCEVIESFQATHPVALTRESSTSVAQSAATSPVVHLRARNSSQPQFQPIVIIGAPRSGTNMLRDVLAALPDVCTWPCDEINYIWRYSNAARPDDEFSPGDVSPHSTAYVRRAFAKLARKHDALWVVEKTCANSLRVGFVDQILPDAKYIWLVRDGRDAVASAMKRWTSPVDISYVMEKSRFIPWADLPRYIGKYAANLAHRLWTPDRRLGSWGPRFPEMQRLLSERSLAEVCAAQWARCIVRAQRDFTAMDSSRVKRIKYEQFVTEPHAVLSELLDFLEIDNAAAQGSATSGITDRHVGKWRSELDDATLHQISPILDPCLVELGYQPTNSDATSASKAA